MNRLQGKSRDRGHLGKPAKTTGGIEDLLALAVRGLLARIDEGRHGGAVRTQAAVVRSLVDELERPLGASAHGMCVRDQVEEELVRLMHLMREATAMSWAAPAPSMSADGQLATARHDNR